MNNNTNEYFIFIDDSGKLYDNKKFANYTAVVFNNKEKYLNFKKCFRELLKEINGGKEIKGSKFWSRTSHKNKNKILKLLSEHNIKSFSLMININKLKNKYKNDIETERILNICIAILSQYIINQLNLLNCKISLYIDEQIRKQFNKLNGKSIENFLNYKSNNDKYTIFSQLIFRQKNIIFYVKDDCKSHLYSGIMVADKIANGINRVYNDKNKEVEKYLKIHNITVKKKFWPKVFEEIF
ncbi:DUF3800 domain-containing protein [Spiroplasma endosymbiont of Colias croceus]|uniref:DUF3800 domain-containing protein n=1 Tax=Spiroplasma endosymbiont of Colias croceus TaxID=3066310 RepID=UPI0030CF1ABA